MTQIFDGAPTSSGSSSIIATLMCCTPHPNPRDVPFFFFKRTFASALKPSVSAAAAACLATVKEYARHMSMIRTTVPATAPRTICEGKLAINDENLVLTALSSVVGLRVGSAEGLAVGCPVGPVG